MKRIGLVAIAVAIVAVLASSCRGKDDRARLLSGSAGVGAAAMGSYYDGPGDWEAAARKAYDVPQPTPPSTSTATPPASTANPTPSTPTPTATPTPPAAK